MDSESTANPERSATVSITPTHSPLRGCLHLPGDKSVSIRRALLTLFSDDETALDNYGSGEDCLTALYCLRQLGKVIEQDSLRVLIRGEFRNRKATLDCRNSGTTARLLMGILGGCEGEWILYGDASLSKRPMERVATPLRQMGADIELTGGCLPAKIRGRKLQSISYDSPVASAQVKSAVLLAGLASEVAVEYREPYLSRSHTENLLGIKRDADDWLRLPQNTTAPRGASLSGMIPADPSAAAFWGVAAAIIPGSELLLEGVLSDATRCGWIETLTLSGADIRAENKRETGAECLGDVICKSANLRAINIAPETVPRVIDEIPVLAVAATQANGQSEMKGLHELRVKESDRLTQVVKHLSAMHAHAEVRQNDLQIKGPSELRGAVIDPQYDHRIAMALAIAGLIAKGTTTIHAADCAAISYPEFWSDLAELAPDSLHKYEI